jgi:hypothetical protein
MSSLEIAVRIVLSVACMFGIVVGIFWMVRPSK